jgi:hypothetical protein
MPAAYPGQTKLKKLTLKRLTKVSGFLVSHNPSVLSLPVILSHLDFQNSYPCSFVTQQIHVEDLLFYNLNFNFLVTFFDLVYRVWIKYICPVWRANALL